MKPLHLWGTLILSVMAAGAVISAFNDLIEGDGPLFRLNGPAGTVLLAPLLLAIVARFWRRVREINWGEKTDATLRFAEPWLSYISSLVFGACLVGLAVLGFVGYRGKTVELVCESLLFLLGLSLLVLKLRSGRAELVLSPVGIAVQRRDPIAWDRVVAAQISNRPWKNEIIVELRQDHQIRLLPTLLGVDPVDLLRAIEVRQTAYTF